MYLVSEEKLREEQKNLWSSAHEGLLDASRIQKDAEAIFLDVQEEIQSLYREVKFESQDTEEELRTALEALSRATLEPTSQLILGSQCEREKAVQSKKRLEKRMTSFKATIYRRHLSHPFNNLLSECNKIIKNNEWVAPFSADSDPHIQELKNEISLQDANIERLEEYSKGLEVRYREEQACQSEINFQSLVQEAREATLRKLKESILVQQYRYVSAHPPTVFEERYAKVGSSSGYTMDYLSNEESLTKEGRFLKVLERLISNAQMLQTYFQRIKEHCNKLGNVVNLKQILGSEVDLECNPFKSSFPVTFYSAKCFLRENIYNNKFCKTLAKGYFRVLIVAAAPDSSYPLVCKLETWPILGPEFAEQQYAALSYVWGREEACTGQIYLLPHNDELNLSNPEEWASAMMNATPVAIRNNLFRALLRLRKYGPDSQPIAFWVDSICINQEDVVEKTYMLPKMVDIYRNARNVCIWLGESDDDGRSDEAMGFISTTMDFAVLDHIARDKSQARKWYALGELMRDRWFSRRWVVQEIALAREATVHCGGSIVRWSDFADAASLLITNQEIIKSLFDCSEWREGRNTLGDVDSFGASILLEATNNLFRRKSNGDIKKPIKTIESLVTSLGTFDTGDQRDLIYSLVGIAKDTSYEVWKHTPDDYPEKNPLAFKVDYCQSKLAVYNHFTQFCVLSSRSLDIICRPWAMPLERGVILPSWIPLLSNSEFGVPEEIYSGRKNGEVLVGLAGSPNYEASGKAKFDGRFEPPDAPKQASTGTEADTANLSSTDEGWILVVKGFRLAKIEKVSPRNTGSVIFRESLEMGGWKGFKRDTLSVPDPIWRTLVADRDQNGHVPPSWYQRACLRCLEVTDTLSNGDLNIGELLQGHSDMLRQYLMRVRNVTWNRLFFNATILNIKPGRTNEDNDKADMSEGYHVTDTLRAGRSLIFEDIELLDNEGIDSMEEDNEGDSTTSFGLCPPKTKVGDFICILYGCSVPVILREGPDGTMELVGEAYVHGKMDGEALEEFQENSAWEEEEFRIR
ncbi:heterokaryon incompatibility protein-domain-containing protein [Annulohypoxylon moriforme]|nr:heterokaryon incompatibility protein-domain-containing protein [Annulohypoxylon moriforme]